MRLHSFENPYEHCAYDMKKQILESLLQLMQQYKYPSLLTGHGMSSCVQSVVQLIAAVNHHHCLG